VDAGSAVVDFEVARTAEDVMRYHAPTPPPEDADPAGEVGSDLGPEPDVPAQPAHASEPPPQPDDFAIERTFLMGDAPDLAAIHTRLRALLAEENDFPRPDGGHVTLQPMLRWPRHKQSKHKCLVIETMQIFGLLHDVLKQESFEQHVAALADDEAKQAAADDLFAGSTWPLSGPKLNITWQRLRNAARKYGKVLWVKNPQWHVYVRSQLEMDAA